MNRTMMGKIMKCVISVILLGATGVYAAEKTQRITVYKTPTCGCCTSWVDYLRDNGFDVKSHDLKSLINIKSEYGLNNSSLKSCHTAIIDGYVIEGHVPVGDILRLISEKPDIVGISAPGMPQMSPGMKSIKPKDYAVLSFDEKGKVEVFNEY